jgi:hypothetical protein
LATAVPFAASCKRPWTLKLAKSAAAKDVAMVTAIADKVVAAALLLTSPIATATVVARALPPPMLAPFEVRLELRLADLGTALDLRLLPLVPQASRRHFGLFASPLSLLRLPRTLLPLLCG